MTIRPLPARFRACSPSCSAARSRSVTSIAGASEGGRPLAGGDRLRCRGLLFFDHGRVRCSAPRCSTGRRGPADHRFCDVDSDSGPVAATPVSRSSDFRAGQSPHAALRTASTGVRRARCLISPGGGAVSAQVGSREKITVIPTASTNVFDRPHMAGQPAPPPEFRPGLYRGPWINHANVDGRLWFCNEVLPLVRQSHRTCSSRSSADTETGNGDVVKLPNEW